MTSRVNIGMPGFSTSSTAQRVTVDAGMSASPIVKPIALDRGNVLRIHDGAGARIRAASGVLWITEENSPDDHVLLPDDAVVLAQTGLAIVLAHRPARVVLELPHGVAPPRAVEMALADGEPGRRIALAPAPPISLSALTRGIATFLGEASASLRTMAKTLASHWRSADMSAAGTFHTRQVERAVADEWTLWRK